MAWEKPLLCMTLILQAAPLWAAPLAKESVNPMTGVPLSYEDKQRRLEELRLDTQLKREAVNRQSAETDLELLPYKKRLEETRLVNSTLNANRAAISARAAARRAREKVAAEAKARTLPAMPTLIGVMKTGEEYIALVSYHGHTWNMREGERVGAVQVTDIDEAGASMNGQRYLVQRRTSTVALTDKRKAPLLPPLPAAPQPPMPNFLPPLPTAAPSAPAPAPAPAAPAADAAG